jgi:hypothetical protein
MSRRISIKTPQIPDGPITGTSTPEKKYDLVLKGYVRERAQEIFSLMGEQGYRYVGTEPTGCAVFEREK